MQILEKLRQGVSLKEYSTFGIGGKALFFIEVSSEIQMQEAMQFARKENIPFFVLGKGSNVLFDDKGYKGLVILNKLQFIEWAENEVTVSSGYSFAHLGVQSARKQLSGLEFASGIPGSVGGAICMNAGACGSDVSQVLVNAKVLEENGEMKTYKKEEIGFGYRTTIFQKKKVIIVSGTFSLSPAENARKKQMDYVEYRLKTQPYKDKSAGCIFCNPKEGSVSAGYLIQEAGLKGKQIGGAVVSPMHANFIVNKENASAKDVLDLIEEVKEQVQKKHKIDLECEVRFIPYE